MPADYHPAPIKYAWQHQPDAVLNQANPVSGTLYPVLPVNEDVRIISVYARITWAVTQPTPFEALITIDGNTLIHVGNNPISNTNYEAILVGENAENGQYLITGVDRTSNRAFLYEGQSISVQARITWAITQPTPMVMRVKWARLLPT